MKKLYRSRRDRKIFGLCGGLAETMNVDATLLRLIVVVTAFFSGGVSIALYVIASIIIPIEAAFDMPYMHMPMYPPGQPYPGQSKYQPESGKSNLDEMMKDIEQKAMRKELEQLRAKVAQYEKGEV